MTSLGSSYRRGGRGDSGFLTPTDGWVFVLAMGGMALNIIQLAKAAIFPLEPFSGLQVCFGVLYMLTGFLFCAAVPSPVSRPSEVVSRFGLRLFHLVPRPTWGVRAAALGLCLAPIVVPNLLYPVTPFPSAAWLACAVVAVLFLGGVVAPQSTTMALTAWDAVAPWCMGGLSMIYGFSADPRVSAAGMFTVWLAELVFLRQATSRHWAALAVFAKASHEAPPPAIAALAAYAAELEEPALPAPPPPQAGSGPVIVDSGSFRVDPVKMEEKLREHQLADAGDFILAWLRCASASGAECIAIDRTWTTLRVSFDGRPFSDHELREPYRALVDPEAEEAARGAQLAYGLLAALRLKPSSITVQSGPADKRVHLRLAAGGGADAAPLLRDPGTGTSIGISFGVSGLWKAPRACRRAVAGFGLSGARLIVGGRAAPDPFPAAAGWKTAESKGWTIVWRPRPDEVASRIRYYHLGALVEEVEQPIGQRGQIEAALSHPDLRLSLSQASVVRDDLFNTGLHRLGSLRRAG